MMNRIVMAFTSSNGVNVKSKEKKLRENIICERADFIQRTGFLFSKLSVSSRNKNLTSYNHATIHRSKDIDKFLMIGDKVLIKPKNPQSQTKTGLYLPPSVQQGEKIQAGIYHKDGAGYPLPSQSGGA